MSAFTRIRNMVSIAAVALSAAGAQTGGGIPKVTFAPEEVGKRIWQFKGLTERVPKAMMFQGYLLIFSNRCNRADVFDIANPKAPVTLKTFTFSGQGDDHTTPTAGTMVMDGGTLLDFASPANPKVVGTNPGFYGSVWPAFQWPYYYSTRSYDDAEARSTPMYIVDYSALGKGKIVKQVGVQGILGFTTGSTQVIGNVLVVTSGDQFSGVSTWDLGDPENPKLLDAIKTGPGMYTSQMYGNFLVSSGPQNMGEVGFYDITDPTAIHMDWSEVIPGMGDYAGFQNGFMFGGKINNGEFVKYDIKARKVVLHGTIPGKTSSRYCYPLGNMLWIGDAGRDGMNGTNNLSDLFVHQARPDSIPPSVKFVSPANGQPRQPVTSRIGIAFDEEIDNRTLTTENISVRAKGSSVPIPGVFGHTMGVVNFTPDQPLQANTTYEVVVRAGAVKDWTGNGIQDEFGFRFSTGTSVEGGAWINSVGTSRTRIWRPQARLTGETGSSGLVFRLQGDAPHGMARTGRIIVADMMGRVRLTVPVETDALSQGFALDLGRTAGLGKGFYRARLEAGAVNLSCALFVGQSH
ncbi:MAG: hypothetical protein JWP91_1853 [Fibrobacteres bacterium]|nr:hypothetical protein [Fibrobacterota bacterium]